MPSRGGTRPIFFEKPEGVRAWFEKNHDAAKEVWIGYYKVDSGRTSVTWSQTVDEALCFGWIDGIRKRVDDVSYTNRFTPRRRGSNWSAVNIARVKELKRQGRMHPAGLAAFKARRRTPAPYSYENRKTMKLAPRLEKTFRANKKAFAFFSSQPPGARAITVFFIMSAKQEETRKRRLDSIIEKCARGERVGVPAPKRPT